MKTAENVVDQKRRSFLKLSGLLGLGAASVALLPAEKAEAFLFNKKEYKVTATRLSMGTYVAMTAIHPSRDEAENAIGRAFEEIDRLNSMLTRFESSSPVSELNGVGRIVAPPKEMQELVARSMYYNRETAGAFDITVKPLIDLYNESFAAGKEPVEREVNELLATIGTDKIKVQGGDILFSHSDMGITLDGIAKGFIVDRASEVLAKHGITNHLINAGGDIRTSGTAAKGRAWTVAIQDPKKSKQYPDVITMKDGAIATSGNYEVFYDREKVFHHIVDSKTGHSPQLSTSVTVMASTVMDADALSTSVFVMEPVDGVKFINSQPDTECFVIDRSGKATHSAGWQV
ncbi:MULTISPECIES: FAD:protein FMN transferase [Desulfosediminicola]|uniref:FAD:protein FMN transferase n=1 Tax=Desulfosediminicola TaxID=2886823 RepID=UPI0010AB7A32|nr:FAD:protein FMN transferase [Desulfosediminicola ganghwensis]